VSVSNVRKNEWLFANQDPDDETWSISTRPVETRQVNLHELFAKRLGRGVREVKLSSVGHRPGFEVQITMMVRDLDDLLNPFSDVTSTPPTTTQRTAAGKPLVQAVATATAAKCDYPGHPNFRRLRSHYGPPSKGQPPTQMELVEHTKTLERRWCVQHKAFLNVAEAYFDADPFWSPE
jgi:hypothetical protein